MRTRWERTNPFKAVAATLGLWVTCTLAVAQTISNPSFEANSFTVSPGYISGNSAIVGWTTTDPAHAGLNPASGNLLADNGAVPDGTNVAFIQSVGGNSSLSTVISDLAVGQAYKVNFRVNARNGNTPNLNVDIAGTNVINTTIASVGGSYPYQYFAFDFTAAATNQTMTLRNDASGDNTVLLDNFNIAVRNSGWSYAAWNDDASSGVSATNNYTHAFRFGSGGNATINGITFIGVAGANPSVGGSFSTAGLPGVFNNDVNNLTATNGGSAVLAHDFVYGGTPESITINGLTPGKSYVATIYSVGFDASGARAATFNVGDDRLTVNQDQFGYHNGIRVSCFYTANSSSITLTYIPLLGGSTTFHTYGFANYEVGPIQIANPSFELNSFTVYPGYYSQGGNRGIVGWIASGNTGLNPVSGGNPNPFADNGAVPQGLNVAFIQSNTNSSLSTVISNLTAGQTYKVNFRVNARSAGGATPNLKVDIAGTNVINTTVAPVDNPGGSNPYLYFAFDFTAADTNQTLTLRNDATNSDNTVLLDNFSIAPRNSGWSYAAWNDDASSGVSATNHYTHAFNFGTFSNATINGVTFIGVPGTLPSVAGSFSTVGLTAVFNNDTNNLTTGSGGSAVLAHDFLYGMVFGGQLAGFSERIALDGLVIGHLYVATIYSVGYDPSSARAATFSVGDDRLTVNQDQFGNNNGIRVSYAYEATSRSMTLTYVPLQGSAQSFHTYGFSNYEPAGSTNYHALFLIVTNLGDSGPGTLRQAIADADPGDTITFAAHGTIYLTSGPLFITTNLNIAGPGPESLAVDGNLSSRVFELDSGTANISGLTIQNGRWPNGGGLGNFGTMVLSNCVITGNAATAYAGFGGGIHNATNGVLTLISCTVSYNTAGNGVNGQQGASGTLLHPTGYDGGYGGPGGNGGGIFNEGVLALTASTVNNNAAGTGGIGGTGGDGYGGVGIEGYGGNGGLGGIGGYGGGVLNSFYATLALTNCTFYANSAGVGGTGGEEGAGFNFMDGAPGSGGNGGNGGGIYNVRTASGILIACTVSVNSPGSGGEGSTIGGLGSNGNPGRGGEISNDGASGYYGTVALNNTIVAPNELYSLGTLTAAYSFTNGDPHLAALGNYGGPTPTAPPLSGSPVIDAGNDAVTNFLATDQRGFPRKLFAHVDIGAAEYFPGPVVTTTADAGIDALREAVKFNTLLTFAPGLSGQIISLTNGQITLTSNLTIEASSLPAGIALSGNHSNRIFEISPGVTLTLNGLTLTNGYAGSGGAILVDGAGTLVLNGSTLSGNVATNNGGAIDNDAGATLRVNNSTFSGNSAGGGGGGIENYQATATLINSTVSDNSAGVNGGGINNLGTLALTNTIVVGNSALSFPDINLDVSGSFTGADNLTNGNPLLAPLGNYGGPTQTMPPLYGSPSIDAGTDSVTNFLATDQRGLPRKIGAHVDIGAVEYLAGPVVTTSADSGIGSLRDTVGFATNGTKITFNHTLSGQSLLLVGGEMVLNGNLTIDGSALPARFKISGNQGSRIFEINPGAVITLNSLFLMNGYAGSGGSGGAILVDGGGTLTLNNSTVSTNSATYGGGLANNGTLTVNASTLSANIATNDGGAIENDAGATLRVNNSTVSGNSAGGGGGGLENLEATVILNNCTISANSAGSAGGINNYGALALTNVIAAGNTAPSFPNLYLDNSGSFAGANNMTNGDPGLAPLYPYDYASPLATMPPQYRSPVVDAGTDSVTGFLATDERGYPRLCGTHVDLGAVEVVQQSCTAGILSFGGVGPTLIGPTIQGGAFSFSFTNDAVEDFTVLVSTNIALPPNQWSILGVPVQFAPLQYQFTDPNVTNSPQRFYRLVSP